MGIDGRQILLHLSGLGIVFYSPRFAMHIPEGADYLAWHYTEEKQVQEHIQSGTIVGFCTGSPGTFELRFHSGYPPEDFIQSSEFKLRLGLRCDGGMVCFRDLFDLLEWQTECPQQQVLELDDGIYHVTLCSNTPESRILGDDQVIDVYLEKLSTFPDLAQQGIPTLCM